MKRVASYREMDLHLLRRTDNEMLHVGRSNNASSMAASLGSGHAFEVRLAAHGCQRYSSECPGM